VRTTIEPDDDNATADDKTFVPTTRKLGLRIDVSCIGGLTEPTDGTRQPNSGP
jgi:hypothetical protein